METLLEQVKRTYEATAALPAQSPRFCDLVWTEMLGGPYGGVYDTPEGIRVGVFDRLQADWDNFSFAPQDFLEAENAVVVVGQYTGVNKVTNKELDARVIHLWRTQNNTLHFEQFTDTMLFWNAMK